MTSYNTLIETLQEVFSKNEDPRIETIASGEFTDEYKKNIFPLVHFVVTDSPFIGLDTTGVTRYSVEVTVVDIRDVNKEEDRDKVYKNDNRHDNWNLTRSILRTAEAKLIKQKYDALNLIDASSAAPLSFSKENLLDGWQQTWTIDVDDIYVSKC
jgi:hypothetical protein